MPCAWKRNVLPWGVVLSALQACSPGDDPRIREGQGGTGGSSTGTDPGTSGGVGTGGIAGGGTGTGGGAGTHGSTGTGTGGGVGTGGGTGSGGTGTGGDTGTGGGPGTGGSIDGGIRRDATGTDPMLACRAKAVSDAKCANTCHTSPTTFGAPMPLVAWQDWQRPALDGMRKVYQSAHDRIHRNGAGRMPQNSSLSASEMSTFDAWFGEGAPADESCPKVPEPPDGGTRIDAGLPDAPTDDGTECVELRAHGQQVPGDRSPFDSSMIFLPGVEFYACFNFSAPWNKPMQGLQFSSIIDNASTLHHWLLYSSPLGVQDGTYSYCTGQHPGQSLITGWAPGNDGLTLPPDVGLELAPATGSYVLEVHYSNPTLQAFQDRSGVRICATSKFRPNTASITWAGTERINVPPRAPGTASGTCLPLRTGLGPNDPIHIFHAWPHMHKLGVRMTTMINRAGGGQELLIDKPFSFASQVGYDVDFTLKPGDSLFTTCHYENTTTAGVGFGPSTTQEMCYDFLYAYPAHALDHPPFGGVITSGAANLCTDN
jgi:hypothetical protein